MDKIQMQAAAYKLISHHCQVGETVQEMAVLVVMALEAVEAELLEAVEEEVIVVEILEFLIAFLMVEMEGILLIMGQNLIHLAQMEVLRTLVRMEKSLSFV